MRARFAAQKIEHASQPSPIPSCLACPVNGTKATANEEDGKATSTPKKQAPIAITKVILIT
jgi:hypothetical protein